MRRVNRDDERGAIAVMVALLLVPMLGFGALVIDVGALVQERRDLQNGADAAAFAVAQDCAGGVSCGPYMVTADEYVDLNATDNDSDVYEVCGSGPGLTDCSDPPELPAGALGYVRVADSTREASSGSEQISFTLARALGFDGATVQMSAIVAWGAPASATTTPLTISMCEFDEATDPDGDDVRTFAEGPPFSVDPIVAYFHNVTSGHGDESCAGPAGQDNPGGFGWLDSGGDCQADSEADGTYSADTGNDVPNGCDPADWLNTTVLIPVYDEVVDPGTNASYHIVGYAAYHIVGYKFPAKRAGLYSFCTGGDSCLVGYFTDYVTSADEFGGPNMGAVAVKLIG